MNIKTKQGFSLAESIISAAIMAIIMGGLLTTFVAGNRSWNTYMAAVNVQREVRKSIDIMTRDLRAAENVLLTQDTNNVTLTFTHPSYGDITYTWTADESSADANRIIRQAGTQSRVVAQNISAFVVTDSTTDVIIDITSAEGTSYGAANSLQLAKKIAKRSL